MRSISCVVGPLCRVTLVAAVTLSAMGARAAEAIIRVFEGIVRAEPSDDAPILERLTENTTVSVDEQVASGWRRIRLADGNRIGWIRDSSVTLIASSSPSTQPTLPERPPTVIVRQPTKVTSFDTLVDATRGDEYVARRARRLASKEDTASVVMWSAGSAGLGFAIASIAALPSADDGEDDFTAFAALATIGGVLLVGGLFASLAIRPSYGDAVEVINLWNDRNPERPIDWPVQPVNNVWIPPPHVK